MNSATFVTALYDIKRDKWPRFERKFEQYLQYFKNFLNLRTNLVMFSEKSTLDQMRLTFGHLLQPNVYPIIQRWVDIEYQKYRQNVTQVMDSEEFKKDNKLLKSKIPEAFSVDYVLLMNNKLSFLKEAIDINPFNSTHFFWIDAGFGHGNKTIFPSTNNTWKPSKLLSLNNFITYIMLLKNPFIYKGHEDNLHKLPLNPVLNGAFFGGDKNAVLEYYHLYYIVFRDYLDNHHVVDDDQSLAIFCFYKNPKLFNLVLGGWYDVFKLFS